jgi:hypothetical protein
VGQPITVRETPAPGSVFAGWTGSITSSSAAITFPMRAGMTLQANFIPNPFPPLAGAYDGILSTGSDTAAGLAGVTVSGQGVFSGRITMAGKSWAFTGSLNTSGSDSISIANPGGTPWTLDIQADLSGSSGQITGSLSGTGGDFDFAVSHATYTPGRNAAPEAGLYTLIIEPDPAFTGTSAPLGDGYASIAVGPAGGAYVAGRMADGTPFAASGRVADNGTLALYFLPGGAPAGSVVTGLLTFESTDVSDIDGTLAWTRGPCLRAPFYPAGFSGQLPCVGSRFVAPAAHHDAMNLLPGVMIAGFAGGGLSQSINAPVPVTLADTAYVAGPPLVHLAINPGNGLLSGIVVPAAGEAAEPVWGAVLQKQNASFGFFRGAGQYGSFSLVPGP